jgi:sarcosine oxidase
VPVAVIGLGVMGAASLWRLAERGIPAMGFEQFSVGHDRGSSHGESRLIRTAYYEDTRYVPLVRRSFQLWTDLERHSGEDILTMTGALSVGPPDGEFIAGALASVRAHDLAHDLLDAASIRARFPQLRPAEEDVGLFEEAAGILAAERAVRIMSTLAAQLGATVRTGTSVRRVVPDGDGVRIDLHEGTVLADRAIISVGPWLPEFLPHLRLPLQVTREVLAWYPAREPARFALPHFPALFRDCGDQMLYAFPSMDDRTVKAGIHYGGRPTTMTSIDRTVLPEDVRPVNDLLAASIDGLAPHPQRALVCPYTNTPDLHFLVDSLPASPQIVVLGGFSGHGFKFAPMIGEAAADLAMTGTTSLPVEHCALDRFLVPA